MALVIAFQHKWKIYIWWESRIKYWGAHWQPYFTNHDITIALKDNLYHAVVADNKNYIVLNSLPSKKMVYLLFQNIQDIIKNSGIESIPEGELYKTTMLVCDKKSIWIVDNSWHVERVQYWYICEETGTKEKVKGYMKWIEEIDGFIKNPKETIRHIVSIFHETRGKISIKKL